MLKNKRRVITAFILGIIFSYTAFGGTCMLYGTNAILDENLKIVMGIIAPLGFSLLSAPIFSEMIGFVDRKGQHRRIGLSPVL